MAAEEVGKKNELRRLAVAVSPSDENPDLYPPPAQGHGCYTQQSLGRQYAHTHKACAEGEPHLMRYGCADNYKQPLWIKSN